MDANGVDVPTRFEVKGTTLTQVVEHRGRDYAYGIVADPWWNPFSWSWKEAASSASKWLGSKSKWLAGKAWSASKKTIRVGGKNVKVIAKKVGPGAAVLCAVGGSWAWYRSDSKGWVRVGDAVAGCML